MKHKFLTLAVLGSMTSTMFLSCQNSADPIIPLYNDLNNRELVEYLISVNVPDEMRTRARGDGTIGESGLFEFPEANINRLRYAVYADGKLLLNKSITRSNSSPFSISFSLEQYVDPTKIYLFFWADNQVNNLYDNYSIDFKKRTVSGYASAYGENSDVPWDYGYKDAFTGYYQLATSKNDTSRSKTYTLKRPFAEIHILTDEIYKTDLKKFFDTGIKSYIGFGDATVNFSNCVDQIYKPYVWHYDNSEDSNYLKGDFEFYTFPRLTGTSYQKNYAPFINYLDDSLSTEFKGRQMEYIGCFFVFVPENGFSFQIKDSSNTRTLDKINVGVVRQSANFADSQTKFITLDFPEGGLKANHKYIYYNKPFEDGGTGFFNGGFSYEILVDHDNQFEEPDTETEVNT